MFTNKKTNKTNTKVKIIPAIIKWNGLFDLKSRSLFLLD